jgi:hypothetical protein
MRRSVPLSGTEHRKRKIFAFKQWELWIKWHKDYLGPNTQLKGAPQEIKASLFMKNPPPRLR